MTILIPPDKAELAYYDNPYKRLMLVSLTGDAIDGVIPEHMITNQTLDQQVLNQMYRTRYLASYDCTNTAAGSFDADKLSSKTTGLYDLTKIPEWINSIYKVDGSIRAIAYSTRDKVTLKNVFWMDVPLNNTGGVYGHDARKITSDYIFPEERPEGVGISEGEFDAMLHEVHSVPQANTVRWTDTIVACQIANATISLSNRHKLLDMDDILVKL